MDAARRLREAAISACWRQWRALGAPLSRVGDGSARSVIDVEALVLLSLALRRHERRLGDALAWWAAAAPQLVSVQRLRTLARRGPEGAQADLAAFAAAAARAGDRRWMRLADSGPPLSARQPKGPGTPRLREPAALMPRLRAAFGVGAKADILAHLLTSPRPDATARDLSAALDITPRAAREAVEDMALSGLVEATDDRPRRFAVQRRSWVALLGKEGTLPPWRPWNATCEIVCHLLSWSEAPRPAGASDYVLASSARDLIEGRARRIDRVHEAPPAPGTTSLAAMDSYMDGLAEWLGRIG